MAIRLYDYQLEALEKLRTGSILCGGVGSGKSITSLAYYYKKQGGIIDPDNYHRLTNKPKDLYIITTARKRDTKEWELELAVLLMSPDPKSNIYDNKIVIDSWNNISKYVDVHDSFFIFDEQRVIGKGEWAKSFIKISRKNEWILLTATPGDTWMDYIPVFIANGYYKNRSEFIREHVIAAPNRSFFQVAGYTNTGRLIRQRNSILVDMKFTRKTISHHQDIYANFSKDKYKDICKNRWDGINNKPIETATEYCLALRRVVNSDSSREEILEEILKEHKKVIVFYNYNYELDILKSVECEKGTEIAEWNGHKHDPLPTGDKWMYLVQYSAGAEGWNCVTTNTIIFYSQNYSYKTMVQAAGRIDRLNTPYKDLYFYHILSRSGIDIAIKHALEGKKKFNEKTFFAK